MEWFDRNFGRILIIVFICFVAALAAQECGS